MIRFLPLWLVPLLLGATPLPGAVTYDQALRELTSLAEKPASRLKLERIGQTAENRALLIAAFEQPGPKRPGMLLLFGQHPDEHDSTMMGLALVRRLANPKPADSLLATHDVYVLPMMNPDGTTYDLTGGGQPHAWRKNRRPIGNGGIGVNLNRNWAADFGGPDTSLDTHDKDYPGNRPFSEAETAAVQTFLAGHPHVRVFIDYHTGDSSFSQGIVLFPWSSDEPHPLVPQSAAAQTEYRAGARIYAEALTDPADKREGYVALRSPEVGDFVRAHLRKWVPAPHLSQALASVPSQTGVSGASIDWAYGQRGLLALAVETSRPRTAPDAAGFAASARETVARRLERELAALVKLAAVPGAGLLE